MNTRNSQAGLTMISWVILIALIGFVALFGFKLVPVYMDYMTINAALTNVAKNTAEGTSASSIHSAIEKQFNVNDVEVISADNVKIGTDPNTNNLTLTLDYDARTGFVANVDLIAHFHKVYQVAAH
ncbi:MAG TPA: DUF4845 domain-containing protein [Gammaproteobacteria bacterium]